jgi:nonsense-mediated mRNA decay protein 3
MICIECGKDTKLYHNLCEACFRSKKQFIKIPQVVDVKLCNHCGARERGKLWLDVESVEAAIEAAVSDKVQIDDDYVESSNYKFKFEYEDDNNLQVYLTSTLWVEGLKLGSEDVIKVRLKPSVCNRCSKIAGDYYEAIVQIRAEDRELDPEELETSQELVETEIGARQKNDRNIFISKMEKIHGGLDFYIGSTQGGRNVAKIIAAKFGGKISSHPSFAGHKDGHGIYRTTFLVKLPKFRAGDFIAVDGKVIKILEYKTTKVPVIDLAKGIKIFIKPKDVQNGKFIGGEDLIQDAVVVSEAKRELQILDPDTYKTIDVIKPRNFELEGELVKILKYEDTVFLII